MDYPCVSQPKSSKTESPNSLNSISVQLGYTNDNDTNLLNKVAGNIQEFTLFCNATQAKCWGNLCSELHILSTQLAVQNNELKGINALIRTFMKSQQEKGDKLLGSIKKLNAAIVKGNPSHPLRKVDIAISSPAQPLNVRSTALSSMDFDKLQQEFEEDWTWERKGISMVLMPWTIEYSHQERMCHI